jgi:CubicO group peptidase (beta-lactamase class C family)
MLSSMNWYAVVVTVWPGISAATASVSNSERANSIVEAHFRNDGPGFTVGVFRDGKPLYRRGVGHAVIEHGIPNGVDTAYCIGSVSKQFTAFAAQLLIAKGKLDAKVDVRQLLPELARLPHPVTVENLIHHTSGLKDAWWLFGPAGMWEGDGFEHGHVTRLISRFEGFNFQPGTDSEYSNSGYAILADVVAAAAGVPFAQFMQERVFQPLGMSRSLIFAEIGTIVPGGAQAYQRGWDGAGRWSANDDQWRAVPFNYASYGTSNVRTTVNDLGRWFANLSQPIAAHAKAVAAMGRMGALADGTPINYASGLYAETIAG